MEEKQKQSTEIIKKESLKRRRKLYSKRRNTIFKQRNALQPKVYIGLTTDNE